MPFSFLRSFSRSGNMVLTPRLGFHSYYITISEFCQATSENGFYRVLQPYKNL
nr:MAG TPA: hypothetical protein [Caudoviricetes sp.]